MELVCNHFFVLITALKMPILKWFLIIIPQSYLWIYLFLSLVAVYGLGYFWAGDNVIKNRAVIKMGVIGKILVFTLLTFGWLKGVITFLLVGVGVVDFVFAVLFIQVLRRTRYTMDVSLANQSQS